MTEIPYSQSHNLEIRAADPSNRFEMPAFYSSPEIELDNAIHNAVLVDRSSIGRIRASGADTLDLFNRLSTNKTVGMPTGRVMKTVFTTEKGRIVDYVTLLLGDKSVLLLASGENEDKLLQWVERYTIMEDVRLISITAESVMASLIGPNAASVIEKLFQMRMEASSWLEAPELFGGLIMVAHDDFGLSQVDVIVSVENSAALWRFLGDRCAGLGIPRMGRIAQEACRICYGIPRAVTELIEAYNPFEVNLAHAVSFTKGCYIGQEVIARLDTYKKVQRELVGLVLRNHQNGLKSGAKVTKNNEEVGVLTSLCTTPFHAREVGLGVVRRNAVAMGDTVQLSVEDLTVDSTVTGFPIFREKNG